jgi:serine/threonine protein kinase
LNFIYVSDFQVIRRQACTPKADVWSIGVIAYILLAGYPPFYIHETSSQAEQGSNEEALLRKIVNADYQFHPDTWQDISPEAISFIRSVKLNYRICQDILLMKKLEIEEIKGGLDFSFKKSSLANKWMSL